jgi:hypothetical protein
MASSQIKPRQDLGYKGVQYPLQKDPLDLALCEREKPCFIAMNTAYRRYQGPAQGKSVAVRTYRL